jgi:hypothetical protein
MEREMRHLRAGTVALQDEVQRVTAELARRQPPEHARRSNGNARGGSGRGAEGGSKGGRA